MNILFQLYTRLALKKNNNFAVEAENDKRVHYIKLNIEKSEREKKSFVGSLVVCIGRENSL